jgi:hypothetical protein
MIPDFLDHLPTYGDLTPLPVPFVAVWSDERDPRRTRIIKWHGHPAIFTDRRSGVPDFGSTNSHRQRLCMENNWCQICGRPGAEMYVVVDDRYGPGTHVTLWDEDQWIINAPLHERCFEYSKTICPHLRATEPYAVVRPKRKLPVVGYSDGVMAVPIKKRPPSPYAAREAIVGYISG